MSHAQILVGETDNTRVLANVLAKGINCLNADESNKENPCGQCISCKVFETGNHPDTFYVTKSKQNSIGVDDVRDQIITPMATKPYGYTHKVFIIDKAETLTPAAQSALLKTIEEPAPYGFFLFLAPNEHSFLPTILSRCHLRKVKGNTTAQRPELKELATEIAANISKLDILGAFTLYRKFEPFKESKETLLELLDSIYHAFGEKISVSKTGQAPPPEWLDAISIIGQTKDILSRNGNTQLALELMLTKLCYTWE